MQDTQKQIIESYLQACNDLNVGAIVSHVHDNLLFQNISNGEVTIETKGKAAFTEQAEMTKTFFQERMITPLAWKESDEVVIVDVDYKAILAISFSETLQPGDNFEVVGQMIFGFDSDKIIKMIYQI